MNEIKTGGSAFPTVGSQYSYEEGMSLRDYFAAKAMQALINSFEYRDADDYEFLSHYSYKMADAMLVEREKQQ